jgi:sporulation protein YlmC with PRC-barrel domain
MRGTSRQGVVMNSTVSTSDVISSDRVEGTSVYNSVGDKLGSIDDLMIDKRSGQVRYAVLEFGGFLGMGTDRYPLPWNMLRYDVEREGYVVPLDKARLNEAPRYADSDVPEYTPDYARRVNGYYGIE